LLDGRRPFLREQFLVHLTYEAVAALQVAPELLDKLLKARTPLVARSVLLALGYRLTER
jgi:hypothetical protein